VSDQFKTGSAGQEPTIPNEEPDLECARLPIGTAGEMNPAKEPDTVERRKTEDSLWPRAIIGAGLLVTVAWIALLGWLAVKLVS
jgi:hypothetical protein